MAPANDRKPVIKSTDMDAEMQRDAVETSKHVSIYRLFVGSPHTTVLLRIILDVLKSLKEEHLAFCLLMMPFLPPCSTLVVALHPVSPCILIAPSVLGHFFLL